MAPRSDSAAGLNLDDFHRLGVPTHEYRLGVIRRAALRRARALALQQLTAPTIQTGLRLSLVATSTYRLLDPRNRSERRHREYVGRIIPQDLRWADQAGFCSEWLDSSTTPSIAGKTPFQRESQSDVEPIGLLTLEAPNRSRLVAKPVWADSLNDVDLLRSRPVYRRLTRLLDRFSWRWVAVPGLACSGLIGLAIHRTWIPRPGDAETGLAMRSVVDEPFASPPQPVLPPAVESAIAVDDENTVAGDADGGNLERLFVSPVDRTSESTVTPVQAIDSGREIVKVSPVHEAPRRQESPRLNQTPGVAAPRGFLIPSDRRLMAARRELAVLLPQPDVALNLETARQRLVQLQSLERQFKAGSPEHWAVCQWIGEVAWLFESPHLVQQRLAPLVEPYQVELPQVLTETFVSVSRRVTLPDARSQLIVNGLRLADQLLMDARLDRCKEVLIALEPVISLTPHQAEWMRSSLRDYDDAIDWMKRHGEVVERAGDGMGDAALLDVGVPLDVGLLGSYYCLVLRRWDVGLEWLTESSDRLIANASKEELHLGEDPPARNLKAVADLWSLAGDRVAGRSATSIRLHAFDLLTQAQFRASGPLKLQIDKDMDRLISQLPLHLRPASKAMGGEGDGSGLRIHKPSPGEKLF